METEAMGRKVSKPKPPKSKRVTLAGPVAMLEAHTAPYSTDLKTAFDLGRGGQSMPAWIQCDESVKVVPEYDPEPTRTMSGIFYPVRGQSFKVKPGAYKREFLRGQRQRQIANGEVSENTKAEQEQQAQLEQTLRDMGIPVNKDTLRIAREENRKAMKERG